MTGPIITAEDYFKVRDNLLAFPQTILELEEKYMYFLQDIVADAATRINLDFSKAGLLLPFWKNYPPFQRGRAYTGTSIPWAEVGETAIGANLTRALVMKNPDVTFPGLPSGADIRFATN